MTPNDVIDWAYGFAVAGVLAAFPISVVWVLVWIWKREYESGYLDMKARIRGEKF